MSKRLQHFEQAPDLGKIMIEYGQLIKSKVKPKLLHLINIRASQLNGCAFCTDLHAKQAKIDGESELRMLHLPVWRKSNLFSKQERAVLALTEELTQIPGGRDLSDEVYEQVRAEFSDKAFAALVHAVACINVWNRLNSVSYTEPGAYDKMMGVENSGLKA